MTPADVQMKPQTDVADGLGNVGRDSALIGEPAVPVDDRATARLDEKTLGDVHPDIGTGDTTDNEIRAVHRRTVDAAIGTFRAGGKTQDKRVDANAIEPTDR